MDSKEWKSRTPSMAIVYVFAIKYATELRYGQKPRQKHSIGSTNEVIRENLLYCREVQINRVRRADQTFSVTTSRSRKFRWNENIIQKETVLSNTYTHVCVTYPCMAPRRTDALGTPCKDDDDGYCRKKMTIFFVGAAGSGKLDTDTHAKRRQRWTITETIGRKRTILFRYIFFTIETKRARTDRKSERTRARARRNGYRDRTGRRPNDVCRTRYVSWVRARARVWRWSQGTNGERAQRRQHGRHSCETGYGRKQVVRAREKTKKHDDDDDDDVRQPAARAT